MPLLLQKQIFILLIAGIYWLILAQFIQKCTKTIFKNLITYLEYLVRIIPLSKTYKQTTLINKYLAYK